MSAALHILKVDPAYMDALLDGSKTFEVRRNDRGFQRGDLLRLREWNDGWLGRAAEYEITYVFTGDPRWPALQPGYVVLGLREHGDFLAQSFVRANPDNKIAAIRDLKNATGLGVRECKDRIDAKWLSRCVPEVSA